MQRRLPGQRALVYGGDRGIGEAAAYLASHAASFMTRQCLTLDGAYTLW
jgi:NAD(P)-dependent dehydrogenase (short-subunit alcohol dehydrogenase family)